MDFMQNLPNLIQRHATITAMRNHHAAAGRGIPPQLLQELQAIESRAQSALNPQQLQVALSNSHHIQQQVMQNMATEEQVNQVIENAAIADGAYKDMTKGWLGQEEGLSKLQFEQLEQNGYVPIKGKGIKYNKEGVDANMQRLTGGLTKNGKGMAYKQARELANELIEKRDARGPDAFNQHLHTRFGENAQKFADFVNNWEESDIPTNMYIAEKNEAAGMNDTDHIAQGDDQYSRKATIVRAWAKTNKTDAQDAYMMGDDDAYNNDTSQGDVARAFDKHAQAEEDEGEQNYRPETYNESELVASWNAAQENENA